MSKRYESTKPKRIPLRKKRVTAEALRKKSYRRNFRRVWVRGHYRKIEIDTPEGKRKVRIWYNGYWRRIKITQTSGSTEKNK